MREGYWRFQADTSRISFVLTVRRVILKATRRTQGDAQHPDQYLFHSLPPVTKQYSYLTLDSRKGASYTVYEQVYEMSNSSWEISDNQDVLAVTEAGGNRHIDSG